MIRPGISCIIIALIALLAVGVQKPLAAGDGTEEVRRQEQALRTALLAGNAAAYGRLLAGDYTVTTSEGEVLTWDQAVALVKSKELRFEKFEIGDMKARRYGKTVIVTGKATQTATLRGKELSGEVRFTRVWIRKGGEWKGVAAQYTRIAPQ